MNQFLPYIKKAAKSKFLNVLLLVFASVCTGILSLYFAASIYGRAMFNSYFLYAWIIFLNIVPVVWLTLLLWFATSRAALSYGISSLFIMIFTL